MRGSRCRLALIVSMLTELILGVSCSSSTPAASPTAVRVIAGTYNYEIDPSATCATASLPGIGGGPVQLGQDGTTAVIDAHLVTPPTIRNIHLSGVISGSILTFHLVHDFTLGVSEATAEGDGTATIDDPTITGRFSGTIVYDPSTGAVPSQSRM